MQCIQGVHTTQPVILIVLVFSIPLMILYEVPEDLNVIKICLFQEIKVTAVREF